MPMAKVVTYAMTLGLIAGLVGAHPAAAATVRASVTQEQQKEVAVTIYNGNLGLVKDIRELVLGAGTHEIKFMDVAAQIDPTTVHLKSLTDPSGVRILEQNYEYDLLNPQKLLDKFVGKKVKLMVGDGNLIPKPTLVWLLQNRSGRAQRVEVSYLTGGITWKADYVVVLNAKDAGGDL